MKKLLTLVAAAFIAVGVNAQPDDVIKVSSGNPDWGQMYVNDGKTWQEVGSRTFESTDKLTAKAKYAGCNLKDSEDKDLTYARESGSVQTYTIEFGATPTVKLQICVNCIIPNQYGGGHSTMKFKPLNIVDNKASFTVSKEDCSFTGWSYKNDGTGNWIKDQEHTDEPQDVTSLVLQACEKDATYPAVINIKSIKRVTIPCYTLDLANVNYTDGVAKADGWGTGFSSENDGSACVISHGETTKAYEAQVNFANVYPKGATIKLSMEVKGSEVGSISAGLQNSNGYKNCGDFPAIDLTKDYQKVEVSTMCTGDGADRLLLNLGTYAGSVSIKNLKIVAEGVKQESLTIPSSSFATYAAYYPVNYAKLGLKAYAVKLNEAKDGVEFTEIPDVVPAGVPVLLKGIADNEYVLEKAEGGSPVSTDLKLSDGTATSTVAATLYALATVNDLTAFYRVKKDSPIPAKRCYLEVNGTSANAAFYSLGTNFGETTGISSVENKVEKADAPVYNLAGQLVGKDYKGLVIKNGKKFVIK